MAGRRLGVWRRFSVALVKPWLVLLTSRDWHGVEHIPAKGGVILAANHVSHFDPFVLAHVVYAAGRWPRFLAKSSLFTIPALGRLMHAVQQIPVRRGTTDAAQALAAAIEAVRAGKAVIIYPEGTTTRDADLWPMRGKTGLARLALATGAPVVPIAMWGPHRVFDPRTRRLRLRLRTPMTVVVHPPMDLVALAAAQRQDGKITSQTHQALTDAVMARVRDTLAELRGAEPPGQTPAGDRRAQPAPAGTTTHGEVRP